MNSIFEGIERIGVDMDGTLVKWYGTSSAEYVPDKLGEPIPEMVERVRKMLAQGHDVVIFTARVHPEYLTDAEIARLAIQKWCREQFGRELEVTCMKDPKMTRIYDDRAITVEKDTGIILTFGHEEVGKDAPDSLGSMITE